MKILKLLIFTAAVLGMGVFLSAREAEAFIHPGLLNSQAELDLMREKVNAGEQPWLAGYGKLDDWFQDLTNRGYPITPGTGVDRYENYQPLVLGYTFRKSDGTTEIRPPVTSFYWDGVGGKAQELMFDSRAAYASALHWFITGEPVYANKAVEIINAWPDTVTQVQGGDTRLMIAGSLPQMIFAAEIMRATYSNGWSATEQAEFSSFLQNKMYSKMTISNRTGEECVNNGSNHNWGIMAAETRMAIAIFNDNNAQFNEAVLDYKFYIEKSFKPFGKYLETCRLGNGNIGCNSTAGGDLPHTQMTLQALTAMAEMAMKQGVDLYGYMDPVDGHSLLTTLRYHAPFMGYDDDPTKSRLGASKANWPCLTKLSGPCVAGQQCSNSASKSSFWEMANNHYQDPVLESLVKNWARPEGNAAWSQNGWGTLTHTYAGALFLRQDVNEDRQINIKDIQICIKGIIDRNSIPSEQLQKCQAVAPPETVVNIKDIQAIVQVIVGG